MKYTDECLKRVSEASEGHWHWHGERIFTRATYGDVHLDGLGGRQWNEADKTLIARAKIDIVELASRLNKACEIIRELQKVFNISVHNTSLKRLEAPMEETGLHPKGGTHE